MCLPEKNQRTHTALECFVAVASREFEDEQIEIYHGRDLYKISSFVQDIRGNGWTTRQLKCNFMGLVMEHSHEIIEEV